MSLYKRVVCMGIGPIGCTTKKWPMTCLFEEGTGCIKYGIMHVVPSFSRYYVQVLCIFDPLAQISELQKVV